MRYRRVRMAALSLAAAGAALSLTSGAANAATATLSDGSAEGFLLNSRASGQVRVHSSAITTSFSVVGVEHLPRPGDSAEPTQILSGTVSSRNSACVGRRTVRIVEGATTVATTVSNASGQWNLAATNAKPFAKTITVQMTAKAARRNGRSFRCASNTHYVVPQAPLTAKWYQEFSPVTGQTWNRVYGNLEAVEGVCEGGRSFTILDGAGGAAGRAASDADGIWAAEFFGRHDFLTINLARKVVLQPRGKVVCAEASAAFAGK